MDLPDDHSKSAGGVVQRTRRRLACGDQYESTPENENIEFELIIYIDRNRQPWVPLSLGAVKILREMAVIVLFFCVPTTQAQQQSDP